ncbi:CAZyme family GH18 [Agaricus bisporus var. burnettii]|uniref:CAZyme family GH18 n=1 Tax=Agaricus bisporus var. burnettii TaxID=192524 RepID=A0A8H7KJA7_AGABI|nr:CAZyme family GH18 [Agaricus bisporus var. burnettii]
MWPLPAAVLILASIPAAHPHKHHRHRRQQQGASPSLISSAWFAGWHATDFPLTNVSWEKYTHMNYAFAVTTPKPDLISLAPPDQELLPKFVSAAHKNGVKAGLSIGGWTGSQFFSPSVGSSKNRTAFVQAVTDLVEQYSLDAIDFDWEFPALPGIGCNVFNANDTSNFLSFLKELRSSPIGRHLILTAAVYTKPFADNTGQPSNDLAGFSQVLDHITIMNYDTKSTPTTGAGPNAPLEDSCAPSASQSGSARSALNSWTAAGIPAHQILLGVPSYGHSFVIPSSVALSGQDNLTLGLYPPYVSNNTQKGDRWDGDAGTDVCGNPVGPGGVYTLWGLIEEGFLNTDGTTPFLYDQSKQVFVSYDNAMSFAAKGNFVNVTGMAGFAMWEAGGDDKNMLLDSIISAAHDGDPSRFASPSNAGNSAPITQASGASKLRSHGMLDLIVATAATLLARHSHAVILDVFFLRP